jgi:hypothetical protein|tara:strand:+ start:689 stop:943 length:255 start_codon:yes stop_codon:yes gene_type:complete
MRLARLELHPALELVDLAQVLLLEAGGAASLGEAVRDTLRAALEEVAVGALVRHGIAPRQYGQTLGLERVDHRERAARLVGAQG